MPISQARNAPEFVPSKPNAVLGITEARVLAVRFTNGDGEVSTALVMQFGTDTEDNAPGVFIMANAEEMGTQLKIANKVVKKGVRQWLASKETSGASDVPATLDIGPVGEAIDAGPVSIKDLDLG